MPEVLSRLSLPVDPVYDDDVSRKKDLAALQSQIDDLYFQVGDIDVQRIPVTIQVTLTGDILTYTGPFNLSIAKQGGATADVQTDEYGVFSTTLSQNATYVITALDTQIGDDPVTPLAPQTVVTTTDLTPITVGLTIAGPSSLHAILGDNTWAKIAAISEYEIAANNMTAADVANEYGWNLGDTKELVLDGTTYHAQLIGVNHDNLSGGGGKAGLTFQLLELFSTRYPINITSTIVGGWHASVMRMTTMPLLKSYMPSELQVVLKTVDKLTQDGQNIAITPIIASPDQLFLLSEKEIFEVDANSRPGEGTRYAYWTANNTDAARIKTFSGTRRGWWLRSPNSRDFVKFVIVNISGGAAVADATNNMCFVSFAFCV